MKHVQKILTAIILMTVVLTASAQTKPAEGATVRELMEVIHEIFGVNFVYDSSLDLDRIAVHSGPSRHSRLDRESLEACLAALFKDSGIDYEIMKKYIVLTKDGSTKKPKDYTIFIEEQHDTIDDSCITAFVDRRRNAAQTGLECMDASAFKRGFASLSAPDVLKSLQTVTGVSGGTELMNGLYVHGGTGNDNLYLYDGVPVYSVSHLAGLYSTFNIDVVDNVNFFKSGFPVSYGGRLSSVVEVNTRDGSMTDYMGSFTIGLINGSVQYEGPIVKGRTSFNVAMRRSWLDVLTVPGFAIFRALDKNADNGHIDVRYAMTDFNAKVTHKIAEDNFLRFGFITGRDVLKFEYMDMLPDVEDAYKFRWGNVVGYADWQNVIADDVHYDLKVYYTRHRSRMNWDKVSVTRYEQLYDLRESWLTGIYDIGLKMDFDQQRTDMHRLRYGAEQIFHVFRPEQSWSMAELSSGLISASYFGTETAVYAEDEMALGEKITASVGLRDVLFGVKGRVYNRLEPRVALSYRPSDLAALKVSYTEMNQFSHRLVTSYLDLPSSVWLPSDAKVAPMHSKQAAAGIYMTFPFNLQIDLEGFYKAMDHIREYKGYRLFPPIENWEKTFAEGKGRAYGMEASLVYNTVRTHAALNYTLSWSERFFEDLYPEWFPDRLDNRHRLNISVSHRFSKRFEMYAGWNWHSGDRFTIESQYLPSDDLFSYAYLFTSPNNVKMPDYHRLDVGFNFHKTTKRGNESVWNLSVYNLYCRMNPIVVYTYSEYGKPVSAAAGMVPIIPTFSYTLKFKR